MYDRLKRRMQQKRENFMKKTTFIIATTITLVIAAFLSFYQVKPRAISVEDLQNQNFQTTMTALQKMTTMAHPAGSPANYLVRDYLINEIEAIGLKANVMPFEVDLTARINSIVERMANDPEYAAYMTKFMKAKGYDEPHSYVRGKFGNTGADKATLHNILVKIEGDSAKNEKRQANEGIMLVSHYDSVPTGPGAGDDGIAVASMLAYLQEAAKTKKNTNDLYFLFTDGEEQGLLGAHEYVETRTEKDEAKIKAVFNFEARGNRGGLFMFESSKDNYDLVRHLTKAVPQPIAFSVATAIYDRMPNDTDFSVFKRAKYNGLNFAMVEGFEHYHASSDTVENLDKDTAYQYMQTVFGVGRYFGTVDLASLRHNEKGLFFPFLGLITIVLPEFAGYLLGFIPLLMMLMLFRKDKVAKGLTLVGHLVRIGIACICVWVSVHVLPASYLLSIPCILFFCIDIIARYVETGKKKQLYGTIMLLVSAFVFIVLAVPLMYMIHITLQKWYITVGCIVGPMMWIAWYFYKVLKFYPSPQSVKQMSTGNEHV